MKASVTMNVCVRTGFRAAAGLAALLLLPASFTVAAPEKTPLWVAIKDAVGLQSLPFQCAVSFPGERTFLIKSPPAPWTSFGALEFSLYWPAGAPTNAQALVHLQDWDDFWFQTLLPGYLVPGATNAFRVNLSASAKSWEAGNHHGVWNFRTLMQPQNFGIRVFCPTPYKGNCRLESLVGVAAEQDNSEPRITDVRINTDSLPIYSLFEVSLNLPDRYVDPFDADQIACWAEFQPPSGKKIKVDAFHGQDYFRVSDAAGERITPQGRPFWRIRFAPFEKGEHTFSIYARDKHGKDKWGPGKLTATNPKLPGFVRVSRSDPRYFEFDNKSLFYPIGHNIRSPYDTRLNAQFPWKQRWEEGSTAYDRYFKNMNESGQNFTEVWCSAWSLGLEWRKEWHGYHGVGQYNLMHAWELDKVLETAEARDIYINLVINNHGRLSTFSDEEWHDNPYNDRIGGYLQEPESFFTDSRAKKDFLKLMRYTIARWGYSTRVFAWELWSELDLTGSARARVNYRRPEVADWHRDMARLIMEMDPYDHMQATHVCGDYTHQNPEIISLPEMSFCPIDAYHSSEDPLHIVRLLYDSCEFNNPYRKPVIVTEFGGTSSAEGLSHLFNSLHAGLWSSACMPMGATPLFWWWSLLEEEKAYGEYTALSRFLKGEERRYRDMVMQTPQITVGGQISRLFSAIVLGNSSRSLGWIFFTGSSWQKDLPPEATAQDLSVLLDNQTNGMFRVEFWDTSTGKCLRETSEQSNDGSLSIRAPRFTRDVAFKVKHRSQRVDSKQTDRPE